MFESVRGFRAAALWRAATVGGMVALAACTNEIGTDTSSTPEQLETVSSAVSAPSFQVYVAYAENERPPMFWPSPWLGSPSTTFLGYPGPAYDAGAILIRNTGTLNLTLGPGAKVDTFQNGAVFQLWDGMIGSGVTIAPGNQVILTQTQAEGSTASCTRKVPLDCLSNFDTSDTPVASPLSSDKPVVHLTVNGVSYAFTDTGQILNTGGFDWGNDLNRNESAQWRPIGTTAATMPGGTGVVPQAVTTWHNDTLRTGVNPGEPTLNTRNVNSATFGLIEHYTVNGQVYAQPLFVSNVLIGGVAHDVVYVATENDDVYGIDANGGGVIWGPVSLGPPVPTSEICSANVSPNFGVTGTPVIDPTTNTLYVVGKTKVSTGVYMQQLHALDITTGVEKFGGPTTIAGSVPGTGEESKNGIVSFDTTHQFQRAALLLSNGTVFVSFGSHCDDTPYHGWLFGYGAGNLQQAPTVFNTTPNAVSVSNPNCDMSQARAGGAIWMAGAGPATDGKGIFLTTGNGTFDVNSGGIDYGDTVLQLPASGTLGVADYFTPSTQATLDCADLDLGSSGPLLLPPLGDTTASLLVQITKTGTIYVVNRAVGSMGKYNSSSDKIFQEMSSAMGGAWSSAAVLNGTVYAQGVGDSMRAWTLTKGMLPTTPTSVSATPFGYPGATPSLSTNPMLPVGVPSEQPVAWAIENATGGHAALHAYDAVGLRELYSSTSQSQRDPAGGYLNFTLPTVAGGKVFVGANGQLSVYGGGFFAAYPVTTTGMAFGQDADGALEFFYIGSDTNIYHNYELGANGAWSGAQGLGGGSAQQIAVGREADGRLQVFYVGANNAIYHNWQVAPNSGWNGPVALGGGADQIAVGQNADGRLEIFYVGTNNLLYHNHEVVPNGSWGGEQALGGSAASQVAVGRNADGRLEIFYVGTNNVIYHNWQLSKGSSTWNGQVTLGGSAAKQITVGQNSDGRLEVFYIGTNNALYHNWQVAPSSSWNGEKGLGGSPTQQLAIGQDQDGRLELFYIGTNNTVYHNYETTAANSSAWSGESAFGGGSAEQIAVQRNANGTLDVIYVGAINDVNNVVYSNQQTAPNTAWVGERAL